MKGRFLGKVLVAELQYSRKTGMEQRQRLALPTFVRQERANDKQDMATTEFVQLVQLYNCTAVAHGFSDVSPSTAENWSVRLRIWGRVRDNHHTSGEGGGGGVPPVKRHFPPSREPLKL